MDAVVAISAFVLILLGGYSIAVSIALKDSRAIISGLEWHQALMVNARDHRNETINSLRGSISAKDVVIESLKEDIAFMAGERDNLLHDIQTLKKQNDDLLAMASSSPKTSWFHWARDMAESPQTPPWGY